MVQYADVQTVVNFKGRAKVAYRSKDQNITLWQRTHQKELIPKSVNMNDRNVFVRILYPNTLNDIFVSDMTLIFYCIFMLLASSLTFFTLVMFQMRVKSE